MAQQLALLIVLCTNTVTKGYKTQCTERYECADEIIQCANNEDCEILCSNYRSCLAATVNCPLPPYQCNVSCTVDDACENIEIMKNATNIVAVEPTMVTKEVTIYPNDKEATEFTSRIFSQEDGTKMYFNVTFISSMRNGKQIPCRYPQISFYHKANDFDEPEEEYLEVILADGTREKCAPNTPQSDYHRYRKYWLCIDHLDIDEKWIKEYTIKVHKSQRVDNNMQKWKFLHKYYSPSEYEQDPNHYKTFDDYEEFKDFSLDAKILLHCEGKNERMLSSAVLGGGSGGSGFFIIALGFTLVCCIVICCFFICDRRKRKYDQQLEEDDENSVQEELEIIATETQTSV